VLSGNVRDLQIGAEGPGGSLAMLAAMRRVLSLLGEFAASTGRGSTPLNSREPHARYPSSLPGAISYERVV
jgi:hypothetical protein